MSLQPGADFGPYRIIERAGSGGMATVYKAYQAALARHVAIKVLPDYLAQDGSFPQRFQREAVAVASLRHPNIPAVFDYGTLDGVTYIAAEYIDGGTLSDQLGKPLPAEYVVEVLRPIASALDYAHARGLLHRDIKPSNIMLTRDGRPVLNDFGLAQMMTTDASITAVGTIMGTPQYMSPEQCAGEDLSPAADIYSLAVVAYEMLTGRTPFRAATPAAVLLAQMQDPLPPPRSVNPALSDEVEAALLKGLAKKPGDRYPTASAMVQAIARAPVSHALGAPAAASLAKPSPVPPASPRWTRRPLLAGVAIVLVLLLLGAGGYYASRNLSGGGSQKEASGNSSVNALPISVVGTAIPNRTDRPFAKGPLVWSASLADGSSFQDPVVTPAGSASARFGAGGLQLSILHPDGKLSLVSKMPRMQTYIGEIDVQIAKGSHLAMNWVLRPGDGRTNGDHVINIDANRTSFALEYLPPPGSADTFKDVAGRFTSPEITNGTPFTLTAGTGADEYAYFFNAREVDDLTDDHNPPYGVLGLTVFGHDGSVRITGMRVYNLP